MGDLDGTMREIKEVRRVEEPANNRCCFGLFGGGDKNKNKTTKSKKAGKGAAKHPYAPASDQEAAEPMLNGA